MELQLNDLQALEAPIPIDVSVVPSLSELSLVLLGGGLGETIVG